MPSNVNRAAGASLACGLIGGVIGLGFGAAVGPMLAGIDMHSEPQNIFEGFSACFGSFFMLVGAGVGGIIGGIAGATLGATLAAKEDTELDPTKSTTAPANTDPANANAELTRLRQRVAELEEQVESTGPVTPEDLNDNKES
jgi:hypothetical protein